MRNDDPQERAVQTMMEIVMRYDTEEGRQRTRIAVSAGIRAAATAMSQAYRLGRTGDDRNITAQERLRMAVELCCHVVHVETALYMRIQTPDPKLDPEIMMETFAAVMSKTIQRVSVEQVAEKLKELE